MKSRKGERSFSFLRMNERESKPRRRGLTEIRGPYYSVVGPHFGARKAYGGGWSHI